MSNIEDVVRTIEECPEIEPLRIMALIQTAKLEAFKGAVAKTYQKNLSDLDPAELPTIERFMDDLRKNAEAAHNEVVRDLMLGLLGLPPSD